MHNITLKTGFALFALSTVLVPLASWGLFPEPGIDNMEVTATLEVLIGDETKELDVSGQMLLERGPITSTPAMQVSQGAKILDLHLTGHDQDLGNIRVGQPPSSQGMGQFLQRLPGSDFQVDSFFDITYRIDFSGGETGSPPSSGTTELPVRMDAGGNGIPQTNFDPRHPDITPDEAFTPLSSGPVQIPILDDQNQVIGILRRITIVHIPRIECYYWPFCVVQLTPLNPNGTDAGPPVLTQVSGNASITRNGRPATDPLTERGTVQTEMLSMSLTGVFPGLGPVQIREASDSLSPGKIRSTTPGQDFPVDSFFDIFTEIQIGSQTLVNQDPARIVSDPFTRLPIWNTQYNSTEPVLLFDKNHPSEPALYRMDTFNPRFGYIIHWWKPIFSIYIIKLTPFWIPIPHIPFDLFSTTGPGGPLVNQGETDGRGVLDFLGLEADGPENGQFRVVENTPPGYENVTPATQEVDLNEPSYGPGYYAPIGGRFPKGGTDEIQLGLSCSLEIDGASRQVTFNGPAVVVRGDPEDRDGLKGDEVPLEITWMSLKANDPVIGPMTATIGSNQSSQAIFEAQSPGADFPADSFFDIFTEISLDDGRTLSNEAPIRVQGTIHDWPPRHIYLCGFIGVPIPLFSTPGGQPDGTIGDVTLIPLPWREILIFYINVPPKPTPTPTSTRTSTATSTSTPSATATRRPTETPTATRTDRPTETPKATSTSTPKVTNTPTREVPPTETGTPTNTERPTFTHAPTPSNTPDVPPTETRRPTRTSTPTHEPTPTPTREDKPTETPTSADGCGVLYSIEKDYYDPVSGLLAKEGDALVEGTIMPICGGRYQDLLAAFLKDPEAEGQDLGLDALDAISIEKGCMTRAFFSVEYSFMVTNPLHPAFSSVISHGDLLAKSGLVIPNAMLSAPFDPIIKGTQERAGDIGLDGVDVEGVDALYYDLWTNSYLATGGDPTPPSDGTPNDTRWIYWTFEEINEEYITGPSAGTPPGPGVLISADDALVTSLFSVTGRVFRSGADKIPIPVPSLLDPLFDTIQPVNVGLDGLDMPNYINPFESDEAGETGPIGVLQDVVLFSTSLNDPVSPTRFRHGDLLTDPIIGSSIVHKPNEGLTGLTNVGDLGLDGVDCLGDVPVHTDPRYLACKLFFQPSNNNTADATKVVTLRALSGCGILQTLNLRLAIFANGFESGNVHVFPGPNFRLAGQKIAETVVCATSAIGADCEISLELERTAPGQRGEVVLKLQFQSSGGSTPKDNHEGDRVEWLNFQVDDGEDISDSVPHAVIGTGGVPSKPVLAVPAPITDNNVQANWFLNPVNESVTGYHASIWSDTGEVVGVDVGSASTSAVLGGLLPGTDYQLSLVALNANGVSEPATLELTTRYDRLGPQVDTLIERLSRDWNPAGAGGEGLQALVPSPVDIDLDGKVNSEDAIEIIADHATRMMQ